MKTSQIVREEEERRRGIESTASVAISHVTSGRSLCEVELEEMLRESEEAVRKENGRERERRHMNRRIKLSLSLSSIINFCSFSARNSTYHAHLNSNRYQVQTRLLGNTFSEKETT